MKPIEKIAAIISILAIALPIFEILKTVSYFIAILCILIYFLLVLIITYIIQFKFRKGIVQNKITYRYFFISIILGLIATSLIHYCNEHRINLLNKNIEKFEIKLQTCRWIAYEPIHFNRNKKQYSTIQDIRIELDTLLKNGLNGIITFSSEKNLSEIPRIVKNLDENAGVIMGIIELNEETINAAIQAEKYVDAYCIGHMFTDRGISLDIIINGINKIRDKTHKPVTTTLRPNGYKRFARISNELDWFFPDIHTNWYNESSVEVLFKQTKGLVRDVEKLQDIYPNKPFLLKMISYPSYEVKNSSTVKQYLFFSKVIEYCESNMTFPERVYPSFFSAYDIGWKTADLGFPRGERHLGFFDSTKKAKNAIIEEKEVKIIEALKWTRK